MCRALASLQRAAKGPVLFLLLWSGLPSRPLCVCLRGCVRRGLPDIEIHSRFLCFWLRGGCRCRCLGDAVLRSCEQSKKGDPELLFTKHEQIGKGSFGKVFKG
jgi:hypothetical protein